MVHAGGAIAFMPAFGGVFMIMVVGAIVSVRVRVVVPMFVIAPVAAVFMLIMVIAIIALGIWWFRTDAPLVRAGLAMCIGGAVSNALDRLLYGAVADFFHFHLGERSFYIFNIADAAITLGVCLLILDVLGIGRRKTAAAS